MFEKFLSESGRDFQTRYEGTFGYFTNKGKRTLVQLVTVDTDSNKVHFKCAADNTYILNADAEGDDTGFEFLPPRSNWHNTTEGPYLVQRKAARQWQRGISSNNTQIYMASLLGMGVNFRTLSAIFDKGISIEQAAKQVNFAVSPQLAVAGVELLLFSESIGKVKRLKDGAFSVNLNDKEMFATEVRDAFARAKLNMEFAE